MHRLRLYMQADIKRNNSMINITENDIKHFIKIERYLKNNCNEGIKGSLYVFSDFITNVKNELIKQQDYGNYLDSVIKEMIVAKNKNNKMTNNIKFEESVFSIILN